MLTDGVTYEVTVEVPDRHRSRFEEWFPTVVLDWTTQPEVRSFRVQRGVEDEGRLIRLVFAFEGEAEWEQFVERSAHRERMAHLETVSAVVRTALWSPAAVSLTGDGPLLVPPQPGRRSLEDLSLDEPPTEPLASGR